jgi:hypothetical protein
LDDEARIADRAKSINETAEKPFALAGIISAKRRAVNDAIQFWDVRRSAPAPEKRHAG